MYRGVTALQETVARALPTFIGSWTVTREVQLIAGSRQADCWKHGDGGLCRGKDALTGGSHLQLEMGGTEGNTWRVEGGWRG